jgi:hypothetical protein
MRDKKGKFVKGHKTPISVRRKISNSLMGRKPSKETRDKLSKARMGDKNPAKRLDVRRKISLACLGRKLSKEHREKVRLGNLGKIIPEEVKEKMRKNAKANANYGMRGKKHSTETKQKISRAKKGHKMSEETRLKLSISRPRGNKHHAWKGGITPTMIKIRNSIDFRLWREAVFARDNWTCQKTNKKGGNLCAHHIQNFAQFPELRFAIDNGITLFREVHKEFHKKYGFKNNTKEQLEEFLDWKEG